MRWNLLALTVAGFVAALWLVVGDRTPATRVTYKGKSAGRWAEALGSDVAQDRRDAVDALGRLGVTSAPYTQALLPLLRDADSIIRANAAVALSRVGPAAVPTLAEMLTDNCVLARRGAAQALALTGASCAPAEVQLVAALQDADGAVRTEAARALGKVPSAVASLTRIAAESESQSRAAALLALADLGPDAASAVPVLATALNDSDGHLQTLAADALSRIGEPALPALTAALDHHDANVRECAADALCRMGPVGSCAVSPLIQRLNDSEPAVRKAAAAALGQMGAEAAAAIAALERRLSDTAADVRRAAADSLGRLGRLSVAAVPRLLELQKDSADHVRLAATQALVQIVREGVEHS